MKHTSYILPGVKAIGWIDCRRLPRRVDLHAVCLTSVAILTDIHNIAFYGEPTCEAKGAHDRGQFTETATLKFRTDEPLPLGVPLGFVVTDVNDNSWLIGALEYPRPDVERTRSAGVPGGDPAGVEYEVKHTALRSLIPCVV